MFFSVRDLYNYSKGSVFVAEDLRQFIDESVETDEWDDPIYSDKPLTLRECAKVMKEVRSAILDRSVDRWDRHEQLQKWLRPWDVVPRLKNFSVPVGDYGIGVEVEHGFHSESDATFIAHKVANWRNIAIDDEGGENGMEVTFPPILLSKFSSGSASCRYLKLLDANVSRLYHHETNDEVGTHVNVSKGGVISFDQSRVYDLNRVLRGLYSNERHKYFGRHPYDYAFWQAEGKMIEYKLFNSQTNWKVLRRYVNIAVALTDVVAGTATIDRDAVIAALESGYTKHSL